MSPTGSTFDAFVSYSRAGDGRLAPALASAVCRAGIPWYRRARLRLFIDQAMLTADPGLWSTLERHLQHARWLVYLASPAAAASTWVRRELGWWLEHRGTDRLILVLTEGRIQWNSTKRQFDPEHSDAVPGDLFQQHYTEEPLYIDLRGLTRDRLTRHHAGFHKAVIDIAALLLDRPRDDLDGAEVVQARRSRQLIGSALAALALLLGFGVERSLRAMQQSQIAQSRQLAGASRSVDDPVVSVLLAALAFRQSPTKEATDALSESLVQSAALERSLWGHSAAVAGLAFAPAGNEFYSAGKDGRVRAWRADEGAETRGRIVTTHVHPVVGLALTRDGQALVSADSRELRLTRLSKTEVTTSVSTPSPMQPLAFNADGSLLIAASDDRLGVWRVDPALELRALLEGHTSQVRAARFSRSNELVSLDAGGTFITWDSRHQLLRTSSTQSAVSAAAAAHGLTAFAIAGCSIPHFICTRGSLSGWDHASWKRVSESFTVFEQEPKATAWSGDDRSIVAGGCARTYWSESGMRRCERGGLVLRRTLEGAKSLEGQRESRTLLAHAGAVLHVSVSEDGSRVVSGGEDGAVMVWRALDGQPLSRHIEGRSDRDPRRLRFVDKKRLLMDDCVRRFPKDSPLCNGRDLILVNLLSGRSEWLSVGHQGSMPIQFELTSGHTQLTARICAAQTDDGSSDSCARWQTVDMGLDTGDRPRTVGLAAPGEQASIAPATPGIWSAPAMEFRAGVICRDRSANPAEQDLPPELRSPTRCQSAEVVVGPVRGGLSAATTLWRTHEEVTSIALGPDASLVAVGTASGRLQVWDRRNEMWRLLPTRAHRGEVLDMTFSVDGLQLATSGTDGVIRTWNLDYRDPVQLACQKAGRNLTVSEWKRYVGDEFDYRDACPDKPSPKDGTLMLSEPEGDLLIRARDSQQKRVIAW